MLDGRASISKGGAVTPGKLTRANDDSNPYDGGSRFHADRSPAGAPHKWLFKKCKSLSKKCKSNHPSASNLTSQTGDQWASDAYRARHPTAGEAAMKRCAQCHGKLGLGVPLPQCVERTLVGTHSLLFGSLRR